MIVLEQHGALFGYSLGDLQAAFNIDNTLLRWIVNNAAGEHGADNTPHMVVDLGHGNLAGLHRLLERFAVENLSRLFMVEARRGSFGRAVRRLPVGYDETLESQVLFQDVGQQIFVFASIVAVHAIVGAHDGGGVRLAQTDLKGQQVGFPRRAYVDVDIHGVAPALLIVQRVVLDVADDMLRLLSFHDGTEHSAGENRVFAQVLKRPAIARLAGQKIG